jgi:hypothetical protein
MNAPLAEAFAAACRSRGAAADGVAFALARLSADEAPGATAREFLPVCGVYALGARGAADGAQRARVVAELHRAADDSRFRVREAVVFSLARIGQVAGDGLLREVSAWIDGYFHAATVLRALSQEGWLGAVHDGVAVLARLDEAFALLEGAPRAAARWPGHKELLVVIAEVPVVLALRFGVPVFDALSRWSASADPVLRGVVEKILESRRLSGRFGEEVTRVRAALEASRPPPRNPDHDVGPTRDRSRGKRRSAGSS